MFVWAEKEGEEPRGNRLGFWCFGEGLCVFYFLFFEFLCGFGVVCGLEIGKDVLNGGFETGYGEEAAGEVARKGVAYVVASKFGDFCILFAFDYYLSC